MPTYTHSRLDLAIEQLEVAIEIFLAKRSDVAALSLAGAAEEILGAAVAARGDETALQYQHAMMLPVETFLQNKAKQSWKDFRETKNFVRNAAKHLGQAGETTVDADLNSEALWMIVRATDNYRRLGYSATQSMLEFDDWFTTNVIGLSEQ